MAELKNYTAFEALDVLGREGVAAHHRRLSEELGRLDEDDALHQRLESRRHLKRNG
jgi:hypothetical protein